MRPRYTDKNVRDERMTPIIDAIIENFSEEYPDIATQVNELIYQVQKKIVRAGFLKKASALTAAVSMKFARSRRK